MHILKKNKSKWNLCVVLKLKQTHYHEEVVGYFKSNIIQ